MSTYNPPKLADAITPGIDVANDFPASLEGIGPYYAIWDALSATIEAKDLQATSLMRALAEQLDALDITALDRSKLDVLMDRLDALTTPDEPQLPPEPQVGSVQYTPSTLPAIHTKTVSLPDVPMLRALMEIGPAPDIDDAGDSLSLNDYRNLFVAERDQLLAMVKAGFDEFVSRFLPAQSQTDEAIAWLGDALHARNSGIPLHIEEQINERHRARIGKEAERQVQTAMATWSGRGYTLPPGALVGQVAQIRRDQADQLATSARELAIHITDKHIENARFAVEQLLSLRNAALAQAMDYMKSLLLSPQNAGQWIESMLDNRTKVAGARADIYKARAGVASDVFRAQTGADVDLFKVLADAQTEGVKTENSMQVESFRALLEQDKHKFLSIIEEFKARTGNETDVYRTTSESLMRFYEASTRVSGLKADVIARTADASLRIQEAQFTRDNQAARMKVDAAMELLKTFSQQTSAALNNMQLSAGTSTSHSTIARDE